MDELPTEFDLIIVGTGMIESILSAAASRIGKTVLHIDNSEFYGGQWASFNLETLHNFSPTIYKEDSANTNEYLPIGNNSFNVENFQTQWHIPEKPTSVLIDTNIEEDAKPNLKEEEEFTQESLLKASRRFNIDLVPKLHFARGDFVELLISSNIARYAEYRSVSRVLTWLNGQLEVVPCSRSDVFANNKVSVIEKRMLMKLLTSLDETDDAFKDDTKTFKQFLKDKKLSSNLIHYVLYSMSQSVDDTPLLEGINNTKRFLNSLGRFGKTPFLFSMYGSGETPQAFCRLSAVFGGVFALSQGQLAGIKLEDNVLINGDQHIKAEHFVLSADKSPKEFINKVQIKEYIARAILITDKSVMASEQEHLTLLMYPPENGKNLTTIIEMGCLTGTCPKKLFLVHLTARQVENPQKDLAHIIKNLFIKECDDNQSISKPKILWSCFFSLPNTNNIDLNVNLPKNLHICSGPDVDLDYDLSIKKAKDIFKKIYPDLEFLPRAPDPEEIIIGGAGDESVQQQDKMEGHEAGSINETAAES